MNLTTINEDIEMLREHIRDYLESVGTVKAESGCMCPRCKALNNRVYNSRETIDSHRIRYRKCLNCGHRWSSIELLYKTNVDSR